MLDDSYLVLITQITNLTKVNLFFSPPENWQAVNRYQRFKQPHNPTVTICNRK